MPRGVTKLARAALVGSIALLAPGCRGSDPAPKPDPVTSSPAPGSAPPKGHAEWIHLPASADPPTFVQAEMARATKDGKRLVLYVGASWCEPCQRFHAAAESGALDASFGDVRFIDLDHDAEAKAIDALGCESKLIPLFSLPGPDGRCTDRRVEGGIKGDGAVAFIAPRVEDLLRR
jgi:thiol-disulfide isomerase/thioredoxin